MSTDARRPFSVPHMCFESATDGTLRRYFFGSKSVTEINQESEEQGGGSRPVKARGSVAASNPRWEPLTKLCNKVPRACEVPRPRTRCECSDFKKKPEAIVHCPMPQRCGELRLLLLFNDSGSCRASGFDGHSLEQIHLKNSAQCGWYKPPRSVCAISEDLTKAFDGVHVRQSLACLARFGVSRSLI